MAPSLTPFAGLDLSEITDETRLSISLSAMDLGDNEFDALSYSGCSEEDDLAIERFLRYHVPTYKSKLT